MNATRFDSGEYHCILSNGVDSVKSPTVYVDVLCKYGIIPKVWAWGSKRSLKKIWKHWIQHCSLCQLRHGSQQISPKTKGFSIFWGFDHNKINLQQTNTPPFWHAEHLLVRSHSLFRPQYPGKPLRKCKQRIRKKCSYFPPRKNILKRSHDNIWPWWATFRCLVEICSYFALIKW